MQKQLLAIQAEFIKLKHSRIVWATFIAFAIAPIMGGVFIIILNDPDSFPQAGALASKAKAMHLEGNWKSYIEILKQALGVGGVLIFGFVVSWIFGREYSDKTAKDLLALPISRTKILNAKFIVYIFWCLALTISNLLLGTIIGLILKFSGVEISLIIHALKDYFNTALLTISVGTPIAFFAIWGKGYLTPIGAVALILVLAQIIAATGYGIYFPWSIPGLYSGISENDKNLLSIGSYSIVCLTGIVGYIMTIVYWNKADQIK